MFFEFFLGPLYFGRSSHCSSIGPEGRCFKMAFFGHFDTFQKVKTFTPHLKFTTSQKFIDILSTFLLKTVIFQILFWFNLQSCYKIMVLASALAKTQVPKLWILLKTMMMLLKTKIFLSMLAVFCALRNVKLKEKEKKT